MHVLSARNPNAGCYRVCTKEAHNLALCFGKCFSEKVILIEVTRKGEGRRKECPGQQKWYWRKEHGCITEIVWFWPYLATQRCFSFLFETLAWTNRWSVSSHPGPLAYRLNPPIHLDILLCGFLSLWLPKMPSALALRHLYWGPCNILQWWLLSPHWELDKQQLFCLHLFLSQLLLPSPGNYKALIKGLIDNPVWPIEYRNDI